MVGKVLAEGETAVGIQIRQYLDVAEEISIHISTLVETFCIFSCPPVLQITASIILTTLIIESVSHLMTDYYADSTIVECSISLINGQTGKLIGDLPIDKGRFFGLLAGITIPLGILLKLFIF